MKLALAFSLVLTLTGGLVEATGRVLGKMEGSLVKVSVGHARQFACTA
jgi:hypothetical protein